MRLLRLILDKNQVKELRSIFFFFKQKTAYEISACLVGSEMCIRDSLFACAQTPAQAFFTMKKQNLYLSSIAPDAPEAAKEYGLGLELAQFCTAAFLDSPETAGSLFSQDASCASFLQESLAACLSSSDRFIMHGPFNELTPAAIDPLVLRITEKRYRQAIRKAAELRVPKLVLHAGFVPLVYYPEWFVSVSYTHLTLPTNREV